MSIDPKLYYRYRLDDGVMVLLESAAAPDALETHINDDGGVRSGSSIIYAMRNQPLIVKEMNGSLIESKGLRVRQPIKEIKTKRRKKDAETGHEQTRI